MATTNGRRQWALALAMTTVGTFGLHAAPAAPRLEVVFVLDTTGSMGDELGYLQNEFLAITSTIALRYPNAEQRWSLVLYRDYGDAYVVRWFDFRSDLDDFQTHLAAHRLLGLAN